MAGPRTTKLGSPCSPKWPAHWIEILDRVEAEEGHRICGAHSPAGTPCRLEPATVTHPHGFTIWLAGGGIKPSMIYGATDEFGYHAVENRVNLYDLNATVLHCLGIDHRRLTYRFQGRDFRLTDVHGSVIREILT